MKSIRQMYRRPVKTFFGIILISLAGVILSLAAGQYLSTLQTVEAVQDSFSVLAIPKEPERIKVGQGMTKRGPAINEIYLDELQETAVQWVKEIARTGLVSAYSSQLKNINSSVTIDNASIPRGDGVNYEDDNYNDSIFEVELISEAETVEGIMSYKTVKAKILQVISLHRDSTDPTGWTVDIHLYGQPEVELEQGNRYLVYGSYSDKDWYVRCEVARAGRNYKIDPKDIDWERDVKSIPAYIVGTAKDGTRYSHGFFKNGEKIFDIRDDIINKINTGSLVVRTEDVNKCKIASIEKLSEEVTAEDIIAENLLWKQAQEQAEIHQNAVAVLATNRLDAMYPFSSEEVTVNEGRAFTREEEKNGEAVCLISDSMASKSGLGVGDTITLQFYEPYENMYSLMQYSNLPSYDYYPEKGFAEVKEYTIVGLYHKKEAWSKKELTFTINTIIVPRSSVNCSTYSETLGIYTSLLLQGTDISGFSGKLQEDGYNGCITFYDPGYGNIADSVSGYEEITKGIFILGVVVWLIVFVLFLILYPLQMKKDVLRMWCLGTKRSWICRHIFTSSLSICLPATLLAFFVSIKISGHFMEKLSKAVNSNLVLEIDPIQIGILCVLAFIIQIILQAAVSISLALRCRDGEK